MTTRTPGSRGPSHAPSHALHAPRVPFALLVVGLIVGGMALLLVLNTASAANEVGRHGIAAKDASLAAALQQMRNEVAASQAPANLASEAAALGMVPAGNPAFLQVGADGRVHVLGSAMPATLAPPPVVLTPTTPKTSAASPSTKSSTKSSTKPTTKPSTKPSTNATSGAHGGATPSPTSTPTPTTTLPGGPR